MLLLSLVPLRWFIQILVDSRLMHFNKSLPEVWPTHLCPPCLSVWPPSLTSYSLVWMGAAPSEHISQGLVFKAAPPQTPSHCIKKYRQCQSTEWAVYSQAHNLVFLQLSNKFLFAEYSCEFLFRLRRLWPPAVPCDPGAQGDKTSITLLYPPAHYQPQSQICPEPWGHGRRTASSPPSTALRSLKIMEETHRLSLAKSKHLTASVCGTDVGGGGLGFY